MSSKNVLGFLALAMGLWAAGACAKASGTGFVEGEGGYGGEGQGGSGHGETGGMSASSSSSASSSTSGSMASSSGASSSSSTGSSSGSGMCGAQQHLCNGACVGNTPESGCFTSVSCAACPSVANSVPFCNAQGMCEISCNSGYILQGGVCVCSYAAPSCCSNAECAAGETCVSGTCTGGGSGGSDAGACNPFLCPIDCALQGLECLNPFTCQCG